MDKQCKSSRVESACRTKGITNQNTNPPLYLLDRHEQHCFFRAHVNLQGDDRIGKEDYHTYIFPFGVLLPKSLPTSRNYQDADGSFGIEYQITVKAMEESNHHGKVLCQRFFDITSSSREDEFVPCLLQPKPTTPDMLGSSNMEDTPKDGKIFLAAQVKNTNVLRGQNLTVSLACRNESTLGLARAVVTLEEEYYYTVQSFGGHGRTNITEINDVKRLPGIRVIGLHASQVETTHLMIDEESIARKMFMDLKTKANILSIPIPEDIKETYSGIVLQISHFLRFSVEPKNSDETEGPSIRIPIHIGSQPPERRSSSSVEDDDAADLESSAVVKFPSSIPSAESIVVGRYAGVLSESNHDGSLSGRMMAIPDNDEGPCLEVLHDELAATINDYDFIIDKLKDLDWAIFFASLSPREFGGILALVGSEFAQPRVAAVLAQNYGGDFTCEHCAAAIKNVSSVFRSNVVENLLPFCVDLSENNHLIRGGLTEFEQIIVALHALNEDGDEGDEEEEDIEHSTSSRARSVPADIMIGGDGYDSDYDKPPSECTLETALKDMELQQKRENSDNGTAASPPSHHEPERMKPRRMDVLLGVADNPQTFRLVNTIKKIVDEGDHEVYGPSVYRLVMKQFTNRQRFLISASKNDPNLLREATKRELIEHVGTIFDKFKEEEDFEGGDSQELDDDWNGRQVNGNGWRSNWRKDLESVTSEWELATQIHAYTADDASASVDDQGPSITDICFFRKKHGGNAHLVRAIRGMLIKSPNAVWGPPAYRAIKKHLVGRRMFVSDGNQTWRQASQLERRENIEKYFELEKKRAAAIKKQRRTKMEGSSHRGKMNSGHPREVGEVSKTQSNSGHGRPSMNVKSQSERSMRRSIARKIDTSPVPSPVKNRRIFQSKEQTSPKRDGGSERGLRSHPKGDGNIEEGRRSRSRSAGKYAIAPEQPSSPGGLEREKLRWRRNNTREDRRSNRKLDTAPPQNIEVAGGHDSFGSAQGQESQGELSLNDAPKEEPDKRVGLFQKFALSRKNSIRGIDKKNMKHPRDMDICHGSGNHPGTVAFTEAVLKAMNKFGNKGWSTAVFKSIRADLPGRRFFIRPTREEPWREATNEERFEATRKVFEAKRRERRR